MGSKRSAFRAVMIMRYYVPALLHINSLNSTIYVLCCFFCTLMSMFTKNNSEQHVATLQDTEAVTNCLQCCLRFSQPEN